MASLRLGKGNTGFDESTVKTPVFLVCFIYTDLTAVLKTEFLLVK